MRTLCTLILTVLMLTASAQIAGHRLTRGGITGTDLAMMLIADGFDDYILQAQKDLPKVTAKAPTRPTVSPLEDYAQWEAYTIALRAYSVEYNSQLQAREDFLNQVAWELQNTWLLTNESYMKVCPNPRKPHRKVWCWTANEWRYRQWANILMQVWRKLPTYPSNFVAYHMNDHRIQLKNR